MRTEEYNLQSSHNHDDRYFTETEINAKIKYGTKTLVDGSSYAIYVNYVVVGSYKVVSLFFGRKTAKSIPTGNTSSWENTSSYITSAWRPLHNIIIPFANANLTLTNEGKINTFNSTSSALNYTPYGMWTYIVPNNNI